MEKLPTLFAVETAITAKMVGMNTLKPQHLIRAGATVVAALTLGFAGTSAFAADSHPLPLWRVSGTQGHTLYLVGSMHMLKQDDYPLPGAFERAFKRSERLIEELNLNAISPVKAQKAVVKLARLPEGKTLADVMGDDWNKAQKLADRAGINLSPYEQYKPWYAALRIAALGFIKAGYNPMLGLDYHFANQAAARKMPVKGLETFEEQLNFFNELKPSTQRHYLLQLLEQLPESRDDLAKLHAAWQVGDIEQMNATAQKDFSKYPAMLHELIYQRNKRWMPTLEKCLTQNRHCFVVVGAEHMAGKKGIIALLEGDGYKVRQLHGSTPANVGASASAATSTGAPRLAPAAGTSQ